MTRLLVLCGLVVALVLPTLSAQTERHNDEVVLQFEVSKNSASIGKPTLRMRLGGKAPMVVNGAPRIMVQVLRHDGHTEAICEFDASDDRKPTLRMKLSQEPSSAKVLIGKDTYEVKIALNPR